MHALQCAASSGSTVRLTTQHEVAFGEVIKVVGTREELGAWDPVAAPGANIPNHTYMRYGMQLVIFSCKWDWLVVIHAAARRPDME